LKTKGAKRGAFYSAPLHLQESKTRGWPWLDTRLNGKRVSGRNSNDELKAEARRQELVLEAQNSRSLVCNLLRPTS
jgi:hypothetical protein